MILLTLRTDDGTRELSFDGEVVRIGRKADNDVVLSDDRSSRHHARIEKADGGFVLVDLGSQNGTLVGGRKVDRHPLCVGDEIRIGMTTLTVVSLGGEAVPPPTTEAPPAPPERAPAVADTSPVAPRIVLAIRGEGETRELFFDGEIVRIGRKADNEVVLADDRSSRYHARIETEGGGRVLVDLGSHNGTLVGGQKVSRHSLRVGDEIRIGMTTIAVVSIGAGATSAPVAPSPATDAEKGTAIESASSSATAEGAPLAVPPPPPARTRRASIARSRSRSLMPGVAAILMLGAVGALYYKFYPPLQPFREERPAVRSSDPVGPDGTPDDPASGIDPAWKALGSRVEDALKRGRYDEALVAVSEFRASHPGILAGELEALTGRIQTGAEADCRQVLARGAELEKQRQADAACAWYAGQLPRFRGASCESRLQERVKAGEELAAAGSKSKPTPADEGRSVDPDSFRPEETAMAATAPARGLDVAVLTGPLAVAPTAEATARAFETVLGAWRRADLTENDRRELRTRALEAIRRNREDRIAALLGGKTPVLADQLVRMKKELNARREKALKAVGDPVFFPAKGGASDDPKRGWRGVDRIVGTVREVWDRPLVLVADPRVGGEVSAVLASVEAYTAALGPSDGEETDAGGLNGAVAASFRSFSLDGPEGAVYAWNRRVEQYNNGLGTEVGADARELARILNDYREMMGLRRCFIDPRLCRSSRKHAAACRAAGNAGSAGKDGTPKSRAEAEGFLGAVGEWITREPGNSRDLWEKVWYRSGGAHRSALKRTWNSLGFGRDGNVSILAFGNTIPPEGL